jgi:hypothetical protein
MTDRTAYIDAACELAGFSLDASARAELQLQFSRLESFATLLDAVALDDRLEAAPEFRP